MVEGVGEGQEGYVEGFGGDSGEGERERQG